jgi:hypothetical protein
MDELKTNEVECEDPNVTQFLAAHESEIELIFPHFSKDDASFGRIIFLEYYRKPVKLFVYQEKGEELHIDLDFLIPE